jgi:hypothetical protein
MRNPCRECHLLQADKNNPVCRDCPKRCDYVTAIGGMHSSMPDNLMDARRMSTMETPSEKPCKDCSPDAPLPIEMFQRSATSFDGHMGVCRSCMGARQLNGRSNKKKAPAQVEPAKKRLAPIEPKPASAAPLVITFPPEYAEIYNKLATLAKNEFRTIDMQALVIIKQAVGVKGKPTHEDTL